MQEADKKEVLINEPDGCRYSPLAIYQKQVDTVSSRAAFLVILGLISWSLIFGLNGFFMVILAIFIATTVAIAIIGFERERLTRSSSILKVQADGIHIQLTASLYKQKPEYLLLWRDLLSAKVQRKTELSKELHLSFKTGSWPPEQQKQLACFGKARASAQNFVFKLTSMPVRHQRLLIAGLRRYAPEALLPPASLRQLEQESGTGSFTELWIDSLKISGPRLSTKQLAAGCLLSDGRYEIMRLVGSGGQGSAYEALDRWADLSRGEQARVILKEFILPVHGDEEASLQSLKAVETEARILKTVASQGIVKLYDSFVEDFRAYLVMEFIEGESLKELVLKKGALPEQEALKLSLQMCQILMHLHGQRPPVIHRDFTPDNLMIGLDGNLKLIDFDVALPEEAIHGNQVVGKPKYIAPEQFQGKAIKASDIYSLGASMHFLLCGSDPTPIQSSHPKELNPEIDSELDAIVAKATAVKAEERYAGAAELKEALRKYMSKKN